MDFRMVVLECGKDPRRQFSSRVGLKADYQGAPHAAGSLPGQRNGALRSGHKAFCFTQQNIPRAGQGDAAAGPDQQGSTQRVFKLPYLDAEGWLGDVKSGSGSPEMQLFRNGDEVLQDAQVKLWLLHRSTLSSATIGVQ
ncbi:hypothetical protein GCM10009825_11920 [Arthrobacter humicola]|uniref:Uncharacterized protein n=1 Tax=Arthrobacter humicola TaxID=409291 RepID=A0ABN2YQK0_9MICC